MPRLMTQPERVEYMLKTLGMNAVQFAKECGFTEASVSHWRTGSSVICQTSAHRIEYRFPQFSTPWIMGETSLMNEDQKNASKVSEAFSGSLHRTHQKYPNAAVTMTYENAVKTIADELHSRRVFENEIRVCMENGDERLAEMFSDRAGSHMQKAIVLAEFVAQLFGLGCDDVMHDSLEIANEIYERRKVD